MMNRVWVIFSAKSLQRQLTVAR